MQADAIHCPFCGTNAPIPDCDGRWQQIVCGSCGARGPEVHRWLPYRAAVESWNVRHDPIHTNTPHRPDGVPAAPAPAEPVSPALERQRRLVATLPQTAEDAEALRAGHRELWRVDLPDGAYTQLPGDPPGPAALRRVQNGIVYDVQPLSGRLIPASKPRMLPGCVTTPVGVTAAPAQTFPHEPPMKDSP